MKARVELRLRKDEVRRAVRRGAQDGVAEGARRLLARARERVPVRTGRLRDSGEAAGDGPLAASVRFTAPYAVQVHENLIARHEVGRSRFLASVLEDAPAREEAMACLARALREAL